MELKFALKAFVSIFIIVDPLGLVPYFITLTSGYSPSKRRRTVHLAIMTTILVLTAFAIFGNQILKLFGITIPAFRIAGGFIIFMVAIQMLQAQRTRLKATPEEEAHSYEQEEIGVVPLGTPMLAGPGAITTVIVLSESNLWVILASILITALLAYVILLQANRISNLLGPTGLNIFIRLMGLVLAAVSVQFVIDGIKAAFIF
ncbi:MAG: MarC family protein [Deltaproteobacteria bacterium]|nr:MarC family protein [Deltaproteobacteria bacterium]MDL1973158.1 MarC family protein [Deltaproteobacteria bacterium]